MANIWRTLLGALGFNNWNGANITLPPIGGPTPGPAPGPTPTLPPVGTGSGTKGGVYAIAISGRRSKFSARVRKKYRRPGSNYRRRNLKPRN